jgi:hypothetical protein
MKHTAAVLAVALLLLSATLISYRILWLGYPVLPTVPGKAWQVSMDARVKADKNEATVMIGLPATYGERMVVEERINSGTLNFNLLREGPNQIGVWSGIPGGGEEVIHYSATLLFRPRRAADIRPPDLEPYPPGVGMKEQSLARRLVERWNKLEPSARLRAILATARGVREGSSPLTPTLQAWSDLQAKYGRAAAYQILLRAANLPTRKITGLRLVESVATSPTTWIAVWTAQGWERFYPETGETFEKSMEFLPLTIGDVPAIQATQAEVPEVRWNINRQILSQWRVHFERITRSSRLLDQWSLFHLPDQFQETFRILILVPVGALMICVLRNIIGFPTFGIFMPVLMALAFRNTGLFFGLGIFAGVVLIGYVVRRWIDKLRLLLVPRLSVLLTLVIIAFTALALVGSKLGLREFMAVGLLPFVILTMIIERFFVLIEESGAPAALRTAAGSAAVAVITYELIHVNSLQLTFFVYPELLFAVAALQILLGRYTGYRLSELLRFRRLRRSS